MFSAIAILTVIFLLWLIISIMVPLGQWVGYCFDHSQSTIHAYSVNLAGSLLGTWLLLGLAWLHLSPVYWVALAFLLVLAATATSRINWLKGVGLLTAASLLLFLSEGSPSSHSGVFWSSYQKLEVQTTEDHENYKIFVNNTGYMTMANTTADYLKKKPDYAAAIRSSVYDSPFLFITPEPRVLVVGAGAGNDASAALRNGASHVDAVEIDPVIYAIGKKLSPRPSL